MSKVPTIFRKDADGAYTIQVKPEDVTLRTLYSCESRVGAVYVYEDDIYTVRGWTVYMFDEYFEFPCDRSSTALFALLDWLVKGRQPS